MNKMVVFYFKHKYSPNVVVKGLVDGDYLFDEESRKYTEGIIQYYQGDNLRWEFPVNPFMKESRNWKAYEELKDMILQNEEEFAKLVFEGDKSKTVARYNEMVIIRDVLTW